MARSVEGAQPQALLTGLDGHLVSLCIAVQPRLLEELLDTLSALDFPVNPQLYHRQAQVVVEFPAYEARIEECGKRCAADVSTRGLW